MKTNAKKQVKLCTLKLNEKFQTEGSNAWYEFGGACCNAGWYFVENVMTGRREEWMGRMMVVVDRAKEVPA